MAPWRTYGREKEMAELERWCDNPIGFMAAAVMGRGGIGKTQLLADLQARLRGRRPMVIFELPVWPDSADRDTAAAFLGQHVEEAIADPDIAPLVADLPRHETRVDELGSTMSRIIQITRRCLRKGAIVAIDDFHNARAHGLERLFKWTIDKAMRDVRGRWPGKLVLAGIQWIDMLEPRRSLYHGLQHTLHLRPLKAPALLEMAAGQGWLADPRRFLSLCTVFGGIPRHWERFHQAQAALPQPEAGFPDWRAAFLAREIEWFAVDPFGGGTWKERYGLDPPAWDILEAVVRRNFRGAPKSVVAETSRPEDVDESRWAEDLEIYLAILRDAVELAAPVSLRDRAIFLPPNVEKIRIIDATVLFQLLTLGSNLPPTSAAGNQKLLMAEGYALERLTAEWMEALPGYERVAVNVQPDTAAIDALGLSAPEPANAKYMTLCSCKRSPGKHDPGREEKRIQAFLGEIEDRDGWKRPSDENVEKALVSPVFGDADRERLADSGFRLVDIRTMARKLGFDPGPRFDPDSEPAPPA